MPIYMNWGNTTPPKIQGDATDDDHLKWIVLDSFGLGTTRKNVPQGDGNRPTDVMEIVVTKRHDSASSILFRAVNTGTVNPETVMLDFKRSEKDTVSVRLSNTMISNFVLSAGGESFSLNCTRIEWGLDSNVTPHTTPPPVVGFDLTPVVFW